MRVTGLSRSRFLKEALYSTYLLPMSWLVRLLSALMGQSIPVIVMRMLAREVLRSA